MKRVFAVILFAAMLALIGCAGGSDKPHDANASADPSAAVTQIAPTREPTEIMTPQPTMIPTQAPTGEPTDEPTPAPTDTPAPTATPVPAPTMLILSEYKSRVNELNLRAEPNLDSRVVGKLHFEDRISVIGPENEQFLKAVYNGEVCYCYTAYVVPADEELYGYLAPRYEYERDEHGNIVYESDGVTPVTLRAELIDVRLVVPNIEVYQIFGTSENFTGQVLYQRPVPVLQTATAKKLAAAARRFAQDGIRIKLYDCYRPKSVQYILYDIVQNSAYIANPYKSASNHNRAAAVDITLIGPDGNELEFPTPMHTFTKRVYRSSSDEWTPEQRQNVNYMTNIMLECGFKLINTEWWHFSDTDYPTFMVLDIDMRDIPRYSASQLGYD